jgi:phage gpG-like protein
MGQIRFDKQITSFEFKPSLGIVAKQLQAFGESLKDMREPLKKSVDDVMTMSLLENFMSGGRPAWEPLTYYTERRRKEANPMILVRSGALADVASSPRIWSIGATTATIRDIPQKVWYGKVHQAGSGGGGGNSEARSAGSWFKKYQAAARKIEGPEATQKEVDATAYKIFDKRVAQHGIAPQGSAEIPARPWAMFQEEDIDKIQLIFAEWVEKKLREIGRFV